MAFDATVQVQENPDGDPILAAAEHARRQADLVANDLKAQEQWAKQAKKDIDANLKAARQAAADAEAEAVRLEAKVK